MKHRQTTKKRKLSSPRSGTVQTAPAKKILEGDVAQSSFCPASLGPPLITHAKSKDDMAKMKGAPPGPLGRTRASTIVKLKASTKPRISDIWGREGRPELPVGKGKDKKGKDRDREDLSQITWFVGLYCKMPFFPSLCSIMVSWRSLPTISLRLPDCVATSWQSADCANSSIEWQLGRMDTCSLSSLRL